MKDFLIAIPAYRHALDVGCVAGLMAICNAYPGFNLIINGSQADIRLVRNELAYQFLTLTHIPHLVMIDADIGFSLNDFNLLMSGEDEAVTCAFNRKQIPAEKINNGMGFCRISRSALEALKTTTATFKSQNIILWDFFANGPDQNNEWQSEATAFWKKVEAHNIGVRYESHAKLTHAGRGVY